MKIDHFTFDSNTMSEKSQHKDHGEDNTVRTRVIFFTVPVNLRSMTRYSRLICRIRFSLTYFLFCYFLEKY